MSGFALLMAGDCDEAHTDEFFSRLGLVIIVIGKATSM